MSDQNDWSEEDDSSVFESDNEEHALMSSSLLNENLFPLKNTWVLYDHTKSDSQTYEASTRKVCEFNSVVKFWQIFNNYPNPSKIFNNGTHRPIMKCIENDKEISKEISSLSVFKTGILPKWEDPVNRYGAEFSKRKFKKDPLKELDNNWIDLLLATVGGIIDPSVTGIRVVVSWSQKKNEKNCVV
jgi:hypothetical protein